MPGSPGGQPRRRVVIAGKVTANVRLCSEHFRITFQVESFPQARPGQFVHLGPLRVQEDDGRTSETGRASSVCNPSSEPFLRRAFSISGLRRFDGAVEIDVIYRVVGTLTTWLARLRPGDDASLLGPQGNRFPIDPARPVAWLVAGGVGLPPLLWFAEELRGSGRDVVLFYGAQRADLIALDVSAISQSGVGASGSAPVLAPVGVPVVISTDDGSLGFHGHVGRALEAHWQTNQVPPKQLALYTCGPERMMAFVAGFAVQVGATCHACVERSMACATGMCQSCVVPTKDATDSQDWRYHLCCTDGPVFDAGDVIWDFGRDWRESPRGQTR